MRISPVSSLLLLLLSLCSLAQAQIKVVRYDATAANDFGIVYSLPVTELKVTCYVKKEAVIPGKLSAYAQRFLGEEAPLASVRYKIEDIFLSTEGQPDSNARFLALFRQGKRTGYLTCTADGVIESINGDSDFSSLGKEQKPLPSNDIPSFVTAALPQEYVLATSDFKRAEIAANKLFELREDLLTIVSGKSDRMPQDGKAMEIATQTLREQIASLEELFLGHKEVTYEAYEARYIPYDNTNQYILFRFSPFYGVVAPNDLSGTPVYLSVTIRESAPLLTEKEAAQKERKLKGIVYRIPGRASVLINGKGVKPLQSEVELGQIGSLEALTERVDMRKDEDLQVYFDTATGAIRSIRSSNSLLQQ